MKERDTEKEGKSWGQVGQLSSDRETVTQSQCKAFILYSKIPENFTKAQDKEDYVHSCGFFVIITSGWAWIIVFVPGAWLDLDNETHHLAPELKVRLTAHLPLARYVSRAWLCQAPLDSHDNQLRGPSQVLSASPPSLYFKCSLQT